MQPGHTVALTILMWSSVRLAHLIVKNMPWVRMRLSFSGQMSSAVKFLHAQWIVWTMCRIQDC